MQLVRRVLLRSPEPDCNRVPGADLRCATWKSPPRKDFGGFSAPGGEGQKRDVAVWVDEGCVCVCVTVGNGSRIRQHPNHELGFST